MAVPFDVEQVTVAGEGVPVVEGVLQTSPLNGMAHYSFSSTGTLVYLPASHEAFQRRLVWVSRDGNEQFLNAPDTSMQHCRTRYTTPEPRTELEHEPRTKTSEV